MAEAKDIPFVTNVEEKISEKVEEAERINSGEQPKRIEDHVVEKNHLSQRQIENMTQEEWNKYVDKTFDMLRDEAVRTNKSVQFGFTDKDGKEKVMTIVPESIDSPEHNAKKDGDNGANFHMSDPSGENRKQVSKTEAKEQTKGEWQDMVKYGAARAAMQAPGKIKGKIKEMVNEGVKEFGGR